MSVWDWITAGLLGLEILAMLFLLVTVVWFIRQERKQKREWEAMEHNNQFLRRLAAINSKRMYPPIKGDVL